MFVFGWRVCLWVSCCQDCRSFVAGKYPSTVKFYTSTRQLHREPLINDARARRCLCGMLRCGFGERSWVVPNERTETGRSARKGPSHAGFAAKAASRTWRTSVVAVLLSLGSLRSICGFCDRNALRASLIRGSLVVNPGFRLVCPYPGSAFAGIRGGVRRWNRYPGIPGIWRPSCVRRARPTRATAW